MEQVRLKNLKDELSYNIIHFDTFFSPYTTPTSPPQNFTIHTVKSHESFFLSWEMPPLHDIHGDLLSYKISYKEFRVDSTLLEDTTDETLLLHSFVTNTTLTRLSPNTEYSVQVLAVNQYGDGEASLKNAGSFLR